MNPVYKVCIVESDGSIQHTIVFGSSDSGDRALVGGALNTHYSVRPIHSDDSIHTVKCKILLELHEGKHTSSLHLRPAYEELYLYTYVHETTTLSKLFAAIQKADPANGAIERHVIEHLLAAHPDRAALLSKLPADGPITSDDLAALLSHPGQKLAMKVPVGIEMPETRDYLFEADPFAVEKYRAYEKEHPDLFHVENLLLLNSGAIVDNTLYLCIASRVFGNTSPAVSEYVSRYYYPLLYKRDIHDSSTLAEKRAALLRETASLRHDGRQHTYDAVNTFYDIHAVEDDKVKHLANGIHYAMVRIRHSEWKAANLEMVFKVSHASKSVPLIKYNPGNRRENLYRFYYEDLSNDGKKIPVLDAQHIFRLSKDIGKSKHISYYVHQSVFKTVVLHLEPTGHVLVECTSTHPLAESEFDKHVQEMVNPAIRALNHEFRQIGFTLGEYTALREHEVVSMEYVLRTAAEYSVHVDKIPCIYSICTIQQESPKHPPVARLKRVDHFREMDAANALMAEMYGKLLYSDAQLSDMVQALVERKLAKNESEAMITVTDFLSRIRDQPFQLETPGFPIQIHENPSHSWVEMRVSDITSAFYLDTVFVYLDAFMKLTQVKTETVKQLVKRLKALCGKKDSKVGAQVLAETVIPVNANTYVRAPVVDESIFADLGIESEGEEPEGAYTGESSIWEAEEDEPEDVEEWIREFKDKLPAKGKQSIVFEPTEDDVVQSTENTEPEPKPKPKQKEAISFDIEEEEEEDVSKDMPDDASVGSSSETNPDDEELYGGTRNENSNTEEDSPESQRLLPDGKPLKNPNPFLERMKTRDPELFLTQTSGQYSRYSSICQPVSRHPVILTKEEMDKLPEDHYTHAIQYGTDPEKQHYYVCPRFWCFKTNSPISEEDVKAEKCGKIIPKNAKTIPKGHYVYELSDKTQVPGFIADAHPKGHCLPCCFKEELWNSAKQKKLRSTCSAIPTAPTAPVAAATITHKAEMYIISVDTFPVPEKRWGYLPIPAQLFLQMDYKDAIDPNYQAFLLKGKTVLLRHGVEHAPKQSFLGVFAHMYADQTKKSVVPRVEEFRNILVREITLDRFAMAHNGSLLSSFHPKLGVVSEKATIQTKQYEKTKFAQGLDLDKPEQRAYLEDAIRAYQAFHAFLQDKQAVIDHTYLWDFICGTDMLMNEGVNLVIMEIKSDDMLERIELVCPSSVYSANVFDATKPSLLVLKQGEFYEPVFLHEYGSNRTVKLFSAKDVPANIAYVLRNVAFVSKKYCPALPSLPSIYKFAPPIPLARLLEKVEPFVEKQVLNYQGKTIALLVRDGNQTGTGDTSSQTVWIPCAPSARKPNIPVVYMDKPEEYRDYDTTKRLLSVFKEKGIPCKPVLKIQEDKMIVGFLTETNQFVPIIPTENTQMDEVRLYAGVNPLTADKSFAVSKRGDTDRIRQVKHIQLESEFYSAFRNKVRVLVNAFEHYEAKRRFRETGDNTLTPYSVKLSSMESYIRELIRGHVVFVDIAEDVLLELASINECVDATDQSPYCLVKEKGVAQLSIPKHHLLSGVDNEIAYVSRLADELVRNERVKSFFYDTDTRINAKTTAYSIHANEFVLPQSALTPDYFAGFTNRDMNPYVNYTNYESATPSISVSYEDRIIKQAEQYSAKPKGTSATSTTECVEKTISVIGNKSVLWKRIFSQEDTKEIVFYDKEECTFQPWMSILSAKWGKPVDLPEFKKHLCVAYRNMANRGSDYLLNMCKIMRNQGKSRMFESLVKQSVQLSLDAFADAFDAIVMSDTYYMSDMDGWVLATEYALPIIVFNANGLKGFVQKDLKWLKLSGDLDESFWFIRSTIGSMPNKVYSYHLITGTYGLSDLKEFYDMVKESIRTKQMETRSLEQFLRETKFITKR